MSGRFAAPCGFCACAVAVHTAPIDVYARALEDGPGPPLSRARKRRGGSHACAPVHAAR